MSIQNDVISPGVFDELGLETLPDLYDYSISMFGPSVLLKKHHPWGYQSITYQEFGKLISFLGAGLVEAGLDKGDRVILIAENSPEWIVAYAAVTSCGGIVVPLEPRMRENEIRHLMIHSEAKFVIASRKVFSESIEQMNLGDVKAVVMGEEETPPGTLTVGLVMATGKDKISSGDPAYFKRKSDTRPEDIAAICYTSGTTGQPKGAVLMHSNLMSNLESLHSRVFIAPDEVFLSILPLHHTFASMTNFLVPAFRGSTVAFARSIKPRIILEDIVREGVTLVVGVPLLFEHVATLLAGSAKKAAKAGLMAKIKGFFGKLFGRGKAAQGASGASSGMAAGLQNLRFCISGAAALRRDVEAGLTAAGLKILQGYGLTEASPVVAVNPLEKPKPGSVGPALPNVFVDIDAPNEEGVGEIVVRGGNVMKEYFKNPEATAEVIRDGALYTGDLGFLDGDGYLTIVGRRKSVIVTAGGKNVYPDEIESCLGTSGLILECIVMPVEDRKGNTRPGAIIVPDYDAISSMGGAGAQVSDDRIREMISEEIKRICADLPDYKHIHEFRIRDTELPKTTTRKLKRHLVKWTEE
jgi:long-chain acyl-CoA synthetase